jgi:peptide/nickel transport system ATP-binding protein
MSDLLLRVSNLKTIIGSDASSVRVVDGLDLEIRRGETFTLLGESGCGKSMSALSIMRLLPAGGRITDGQVELNGVDLLKLSELDMRRVRGGRMAMIFQEPMSSLNPVMAVGRQIAESVELHDKLSGSAITRRVVQLLDDVGIPDPERRAQEYPHQLSGGMKQRVMIAMALAGRPELLIADEPTTALDVTIQAQVLELMKRLQHEHGMAILQITHDLGVVAETTDHLAVMYAGQVVERASCKEFFNKPLHPYSQKLFDSLPTQQKRGQSLTVIKGTVPPLDQEFVGCRFADRCDYVLDECRSSEPAWDQLAEGQGVRCHLYDQLTASDVTPEAIEPRAAPQEHATLLNVSDLKVHFPIQKGLFRRTVGAVKAVDGLSLQIREGRTLALVGESGCGKTTVGKSILQLIPPTDGRVQFDGDELTQLNSRELRKRRRDMQIIFQDPASSMNPRMLVGDIVEEGMLAQSIGRDRADRREKVEALLEQVGLSKTAISRYPHEFSGGQRQRICIARALAVNPRLIICDEPTSALDVSVQAQILNLLKQLQNELSLSYLFITHNISVVAYLADEVAVMYLGRIVEQGTAEEILQSPAHPYTQALLSAVPLPELKKERERIHLQGDMPSPAAPPVGCHFHPRCNRVTEQCKQSYPAAVTKSETHIVCCINSD